MQKIKEFFIKAAGVARTAFKKSSAFITQQLSRFDGFLCTSKPSFIFLLVCSFFMNILLEAALRRSIIEAFLVVFTQPLVFLIGFLIVFATFSVMYLFKRRFFIFNLVTILWIVITCISYYLMCQRTTPFNSSDFRVLKTTFDIITIYLSPLDIVLVILGIVLLLALLITTFIKCRKAKGLLSRTSFIPLIACSVTVLAVVLNTVYVVAADRFDNLPNKYREHGFAFCFLYSIIDNGIDRPDNYNKTSFLDHRDKTNHAIISTPPQSKPSSETVPDRDHALIDKIYEMVIDGYDKMPDYLTLDFTREQADEIISHINTGYKYMKAVSSMASNITNADNPEEVISSDDGFDKPNVIFLQLESFYDVTNIDGYEYSDAPHPIYSMLKDELPGGLLTVPSIGAGTANTEFEVLTGMDVSFFGIAEYPYLSVLQSNTCESMAYNAKEYGYVTHAIHNHKGTFYDRNKIYPHLGFDTFTSIENMPTIIRNKRNWGKDIMLIDPILQSLDSSDGKDLIFSVSVQPHGRYPSEAVYNRLLEGQEPKIGVSGNEDNPENPGFTYYVNQLNDVDTFIGNLILELNFRNEPTVLVMYGDHLPAFSVQKYWNLKEGDCYQTDYMIWNNCGIDFSDAKDLTTFQLGSYVFSKLGIDSGDFNMLNRLYLDSNVDDYAHLRHIYQYATLYDNALKKPNSDVTIPTYEPAETVFGIVRTSVAGIYTIGDTTYVRGKNFNEFSRIAINGEVVETEVLDNRTLSSNASFTSGDFISVVQLAVNHAILGVSENSHSYSDFMIIPEEKHQQYIDLIVPVIPEDTPEEVIDDATIEFQTGNDDMNMIQEDISESLDDEGSLAAQSIVAAVSDGDVTPSEETNLLG